MNQAEQNYIHGTAAKKIEYDVYEENNVLKAKRKHKTNNKAKLKVLCNIFVVFVLIFLVIFRYAMITELNYNIDKSLKEYNTIKNENSILRVNIEKETDLYKIKEIAENKLGMHKPDKFQIVYVNVPKNDFSVVSEEYSGSKKNNNLFGVLTDKLGKLTHLVY